MSLTIISINAKQLYIASDKRCVDAFNDYKVVDDNSVKTLKIREDLFLNAGGVGFQSQHFESVILKHKHLSSQELVKLISGMDRHWEWPGVHAGKSPELPRCSDMFLAGLDEEKGKLFLWQGHNDGTCSFNYVEENMSGHFVYSYNKKVMQALSDFYQHNQRLGLKMTDNVDKCMSLGAHIDSKFISREYDSWLYKRS